MTRLLLASRNAKKLAELRRLVITESIEGIEVIGLDEVPPFDEAPESGATFEANALAKAVDGCAATGLACLADDSGIEIDELRGMPGVLSARWAGRHGDDRANLELVLAQLRDTPSDRRGAGFVSACALVTPDGQQTVVRGQWRGTVATAPSGDGGFGYDPIFLPVQDRDDVQVAGRSAAQLSAAEKDALSHRGRALTLLIPRLRELGVS